MSVRVLTVAARKGGVGKTATAVNLAAALAESGRRVLVLDCDPQGTASVHLGADPEGPGLAEVLEGEATIGDVARPSSAPGVEVVTAASRLAAIERQLAGEPGGEAELRAALEDAARLDRWDLAVLDSPPALGLLAVAAILAASVGAPGGGVLVVAETRGAGLAGARQALETLDRIRRRLAPGLRLVGILPTRATRTRLSVEALEALRRAHGDAVLEAVIRERTHVAEAWGRGLPVTLHAPTGDGAADHRAAAAEIARRLEGAT